MWHPKNSLYSTENFGSHLTGAYYYDNFSGQSNVGGVVSLRNIATGKAVVLSPGEPWPPLAWDQTDDFSLLWGATSGNYTVSGGTVLSNIAFGTIGLTGETTIFQQGGYHLHTAGQATGYFGANADFSTGFVVESSVLISSLTGDQVNGDNMYGMAISDGTNHELIQFRLTPSPGFIIGTGEYQTYIPATGIGSQLIGFRYGLRGRAPNSTGHFITSEGFQAIITGAGNSPKHIEFTGVAIGQLGGIGLHGGAHTQPTSRVEIGRFYQKHGVIDIAGDFIDDTFYSTDPLSFKTQPYQPRFGIQRFEKAFINLVGHVGGTTTVKPEIRNNETSGFVDLLSTGLVKNITEAGGLFELDLSTGQVLGDGSDEIRFEIGQVSNDGAEPPLAVDYITVTYSRSAQQGIVGLNPEIGSSEGEYGVLLTIDPRSRRHEKRAKFTANDDAIILPLNEGDGLISGSTFLYKAEGGSFAFSGVTDDQSTRLIPDITGRFGGAPKNFRGLTRETSVLGPIFPTGVVGTPTFNTRPIGDGEILVGSDFGIGVPASTGGGVPNLTSAPTVSGSFLEAYTSPERTGAPAASAGFYNVGQLSFSDDLSGHLVNHVYQRVRSIDGYGFETPHITPSSSYDFIAVDAIIQVGEGALGISITGAGAGVNRPVTVPNTVVYPHERYGVTQRVRTIFPYSNKFRIQMYGVNDDHTSIQGQNIDFTVANMRVRGFNNDTLLYTGLTTVSAGSSYLTGLTTSANEICIDAWIHPDGHPHLESFTGNVVDLLETGGNTYSLGVSTRGFPTFRHNSAVIKASARIMGNGSLDGASGTSLILVNTDGSTVTFTTDPTKNFGDTVTETESPFTINTRDIGGGSSNMRKATQALYISCKAAIDAGVLYMTIDPTTVDPVASGQEYFDLTQTVAGADGNTAITLIAGVTANGETNFTGGVGSDCLVTGVNGIDTNRWHHILGQYNNKHERLEIYLDGELGGVQQSPFSAVDAGQIDLNIGTRFAGAIEQVRIRKKARNPHEIAVFDAFSAPPKFQSQFQIETGDTIVHYRFDRGTIVDFSTGEFHCVVPDSKDQYFWTERETEGIFGEGITFMGNEGACKTAQDVSPGSLNNVSFAGYVANVPTDGTPRIFEWGDYKLIIEDGKFVFDTQTATLTGTTQVDQTIAYSWFLINVSNESPDTMITGYYGTGIGFSNPVMDFSGAVPAVTKTQSDFVMFGHDTGNLNDFGDIFLDEFLITGGLLGTGVMPLNVFKQKPDETVYLNNQPMSTGRIIHLGVYDKEVVVPPRSSFDSTGALISFGVDTLVGRLDASPVFTYLGSRRLVPTRGSAERFDELSDKICKTKSPFRIGKTAPQNSVNLAFMTTPPFSVDNNLSLISAPDNNSENFVPSFKEYRVLSPVTSGNALAAGHTVTYDGEIETDDIILTNYVTIREQSSAVSPLFYAHKLGGSQFEVYQDGGTNQAAAGDYTLIRDNIKLYGARGDNITPEQMPWDIRISKRRSDGFELPTNVYNVELLLRDRFIPGETMFVEYVAADPVKNYALLRGYREVVNAEPIFRHLSAGTTQETFTTTDAISQNILPGATKDHSYNPGPSMTVNHLTGDFWSPGVHDDLINEDDFLV